MAMAASNSVSEPLLNSSFIPSAGDLVYMLPRLAKSAKSWLLSETSSPVNNNTISALPAAASATGAAAVANASSSSYFGWLSVDNVQRLGNVDGIFSYVLSRWAISTCFMAIILNRSLVYSSSRRHIALGWVSRLTLRIVPIATFIYQILSLLQALRCQTGSSPPPIIVTGLEKASYYPAAGGNDFLYWLSSSILFWQDDNTACVNAGMVPTGEDKLAYLGSSTILWPLFLTLCLSHLIETISCSLEGRPPMAETGMTIFEHSLAFAEAEAVVRSSAGMSFFGGWQASRSPSTTSSKLAAPTGTNSSRFMVTPGMLLSRLNVPPEVLLIGLISSCSHLSSHVLAVTGLQSRFRLVNTGIWGICFMSAFLWSFIRFSRPATIEDIGVLRYPTVCIIGFIPHLMIVAGILTCSLIYGIALVATMLSPPRNEQAKSSIADRFHWAKSNMQANVSLANIKISWHEEFYTTLLKVGFTVLTAASEAVYFNEGTDVTMSPMTWLEEKRLTEISVSRKLAKRMRDAIPPEIQGDASIAEGIGLVEEDQMLMSNGRPVNSGYARERRTTESSSNAGVAAVREEGVGGGQRSGRWFMSWRLLRETSSLLGCMIARAWLYVSGKLGGPESPQWVWELAREETKPAEAKPVDKELEFWVLSDGGELKLPETLNTDVEEEVRKRTKNTDPRGEKIDDNLYKWWKNNGWWGEVDSSGDFNPSQIDEDLTSVISESESRVDTDGWQTESEDDGQRTPTRLHPHRGASTEPEDLMSHLSVLLDPRTIQEKQDAKLLARRLQQAGPTTRSAYQRGLQQDTVHLLAPHLDPDAPLTAEEEEDLLERIIRSRRSEKWQKRQAQQQSNGTPSSWSTGASGMGDAGPQCVVCHSDPRTILVWPCRCLSLCEDCRVSLAMNNFGSCVCCRRDVVAFSRLYVP
ncbi:hypothetical protein FH972_022323 [Carpinus fangiana]|uniref:RING-type domain-containing protein n=1 Tax=Carpinus fangiana TaxID=176857 RepID=A0A5N6KU58_9ROSI|nr:hypothetical protein FH972_022323 [Carpinus fangiana]